ncbi:MAG: type IV toxin-antitoxin system AbiEi family antitoxin [Coriobacteriia bacterium]|nr:type IV toxin-antitoxin system AbiEi family antitoxin [Coriobacteriia bacterium]MCL2750219.1 type IV toxin-antitoxin system AbiEi family antitoxin [Coriobacteriia bacterium]
MAITVDNNTAAVERPLVKAPQAADWALSHGMSSLTTSEAAEMLGTTASQVPQRLSSAKKRGEWMTPARGLWIPVPPEYRTWGGSPAVEFIDAMMAHLNTHYYVGWLSAAAIHGSAHHAPQVTQVAVSRMIRSRVVGRVRLEFFIRSSIKQLPVVSKMARSGSYRVSSAEVTALDLCANVKECGGIDNVATVMAGLVDAAEVSMQGILDAAAHYCPAAIRRLGWLLENHTELPVSDDLRAYASNLTETPSLLDPLSRPGGKLDSRWMLRLNTNVEAEE